ncbi:hypothetical protein HaLaN_29904, partial [Haematococcus lacustris]
VVDVQVGRPQRRPRVNPRNLTISASHWSLCSCTAACAREQITSARRVSLARYVDGSSVLTQAYGKTQTSPVVPCSITTLASIGVA